MKIMRSLALVILLPFCVWYAGCTKSAGTADREAHRRAILEWQSKRLARLTSENGWLTLCGLFWLKEGENTFGTDSSNSIVFPAGKAPGKAGSIWLEHGTLRLQSTPGAGIRCRDSIVSTMTLASDGEGSSDPTVLSIGTLSFYVIKRADQLGVRVKDKENPARVHFRGLDYFPIDPTWRIEARFEPYHPPKIIPIATMIGTTENDSCPGALVFGVDGKECRLDAVIEQGSDRQLFIMMSDETSGKETYGMGRQLYTDLPDSTGKVILDFNKAYNWPCVFTVFATCPIPPRQNRLPLRVEAGEKMYAGH
jgi:uncharacterized protein